MNCLLEGNCVKAFGKAIHALSRIGDELWLDPMVKGLALRAVNSAHSAYAYFLFSPLFFQRYSLAPVSERGSEVIKCKLLMKSILPLFRCLTAIERNVEQCQLSVSSSPTDRVTIQFFCRHGIRKTHNLRFQESEALQAVFTSHLCPNVLKASARLLGDMVVHFPASQEEITLSATPLRVSLRNYCEKGKDRMQMMYTEMSLHPDEFEHFQVGLGSDITFCLKELRSLRLAVRIVCMGTFPSALRLVFIAKRVYCPLQTHIAFQCRCISVLQENTSCYVDAVCRPVCFSVEDMVLEAAVVLATLVDSESSSPSQATGTAAPVSPRCADAAVPPAASCGADSTRPGGVPEEMELIPSSQGSPKMSPPNLMLLLPQTDDPNGLHEFDEECAGAPDTPASSTICSLLFRATSSQQDDHHAATTLSVLACCSDDENMEEDNTRSPSL